MMELKHDCENATAAEVAEKNTLKIMTKVDKKDSGL